jgi:predicted 2-oxoglutarate/Fe(II)-dependent dioxygenase YbiX
VWQPWTSFHFDNAETTVNVALSPDDDHSGGRLLGLFGGAVQSIERGEGEATVHSSSLLHGVSRMTGGVRYSLIMFFAHA